MSSTSSGKNSSSKQKVSSMSSIEPSKCIIEDWEFLAFENEEQLNYYSVWHEALVDQRRELNAETERDRQIMRNERARRTRQLIRLVGYDDLVADHNDVGSKDFTSSSRASKGKSRSAASSRQGQKARAAAAAAAAAASPGASFQDLSSISPLAKASRSPLKRIADSLVSSSSSGSMRRANGKILGAHSSSQANQSKPTRSPLSSSRRAIQSAANVSANFADANYSQPPLPNGYSIINSSDMNSMQASQQIVRYKLTKMYNKYRGRQDRRSFVQKKQMDQRVAEELSRCHLSPWLAYSALQALRLPRECMSSGLSVTTNPHANTYLTASCLPPVQQPATQSAFPATTAAYSPATGLSNLPQLAPQFPSMAYVGAPHMPPPPVITVNGKKLENDSIVAAKKSLQKAKSIPVKTYAQNSALPQQQQPQTNGLTNGFAPPTPQPAANGISNQLQQQQQPARQPMQLFYIDTGNMITYSNRINPQQVAEYKRKAHLMPLAATSKKSSAASYDAAEIMEVLANTTKTNVTITRNTIKAPKQQAAAGGQPPPAETSSVTYSHSVNPNTPGIVSTQLHLQTKSYFDSLGKLYKEEAERIRREEELKPLQQPEEENQEIVSSMSRFLFLD